MRNAPPIGAAAVARSGFPGGHQGIARRTRLRLDALVEGARGPVPFTEHAEPDAAGTQR
ncbi:hypothetical protein ACFY9A_37020 [Streptomyces rubradiris]|uniref:hypothetical protein n=1 Tax=Streptomyces rubradiris TaxID=285531 RepID=UPI0036EB5B8A